VHQRPRNAHGGFARRLAATPAIVADAVFFPVGVIGMAGRNSPRCRRNPWSAHRHFRSAADRRAGGLTFEYAERIFTEIRFPALGRVFGLSGLALVEPYLNVRSSSAMSGARPSTTQRWQGRDFTKSRKPESVPKVLLDIYLVRFAPASRSEICWADSAQACRLHDSRNRRGVPRRLRRFRDRSAGRDRTLQRLR